MIIIDGTNIFRSSTYSNNATHCLYNQMPFYCLMRGQYVHITRGWRMLPVNDVMRSIITGRSEQEEHIKTLKKSSISSDLITILNIRVYWVYSYIATLSIYVYIYIALSLSIYIYIYVSLSLSWSETLFSYFSLHLLNSLFCSQDNVFWMMRLRYRW